tara:strand:+ start:385 stop:684 length:300 start_codon:yes stop_codon:yes gene_type:complete
MKTIIDEQNCSKYLFEDDKQLNITADQIEVGSPAKLDFIIGDLNSTNATIHLNTTPPADWQGGRYTFDSTTWVQVAGWVDPKVAQVAELQAQIDALNAA